MDLNNPAGISVSTRMTTTNSGLAARARVLKAAFVAHWPEYVIEGAGLCIFMVSACLFTVVLFHPASPVVRIVFSSDLRRVLMGSAMGITAIAIIFSPFGKRSGAHINPAVTLTYFRLGKLTLADAAFYTLFQFIGGALGVVIARTLMGESLVHQSVKYAVTVPGPLGPLAAFGAELIISFLMMTMILNVSDTPRLSRWTGIFAGLLVAIYISIEAPISGMSMNPARTFASASVANIWTALWVYFTAPPAGMLLAAEIFKQVRRRTIPCAKLHHHNNQRCIFNCEFQLDTAAQKQVNDE